MLREEADWAGLPIVLSVWILFPLAHQQEGGWQGRLLKKSAAGRIDQMRHDDSLKGCGLLVSGLRPVGEVDN
jgi:hypothetical protein